MKRQRHIRAHALAILIGLTCGVLLVVILAFNLSVRGYIRARVAAQLVCAARTPPRCGTAGCMRSGVWSPT